MMDDDDHDLMRAWRDAAQEAPGESLDRRILAAARVRQARRPVLPLLAALAACLMLVFFSMERKEQQGPHPVPVAVLDTATIGLYEGRGADILASPGAMQDIMIHQAPVGSGPLKPVSP